MDELTPIYCPHCENACSGAAESCPSCGHPLAEPKTPLVTIVGKPRWIIASATVTVVACVLWASFGPVRSVGVQSAKMRTSIDVMRELIPVAWTFQGDNAIGGFRVLAYDLDITSELKLQVLLFSDELNHDALADVRCTAIGSPDQRPLQDEAFKKCAEVLHGIVPGAKTMFREAARVAETDDGLMPTGIVIRAEDGWEFGVQYYRALQANQLLSLRVTAPALQ